MNKISNSRVGIGKITIPNAANTIIGVPKPPSTTERLDHSDVKILLIEPPKNECDNVYLAIIIFF